MTKTLWSASETTSCFEIPTYIKVTAHKIDEINDSMNIYEDEQGTKYIVRFNSFKRRDEFVRV